MLLASPQSLQGVVLIKINKWTAVEAILCRHGCKSSAGRNDYRNVGANQISRAGYAGKYRDAVQSGAKSVRTSALKHRDPFERPWAPTRRVREEEKR